MAKNVSSCWLRWDVHIHAPGTSQNDKFGGNWDAYLTRIENSTPPPVALGITDYFSIATYEEFLRHYKAGRAPNVELVFPNIELRLLPQTAKGHPLNVHILVSPHDDDHAERIREALSHLTVVLDRETISCTRAGLILLGKLHSARGATETKDEQALYCKGVEQFKLDLSQFRDWYRAEEWLKRNSLLAIAGGNDGLAGIRRDSGFREYHDQLVRETHIILSGQPSDWSYFLGNGADGPNEVKTRYGRLKPCLHGCDAHSVEKTLDPDQGRRCWIKAYPCFDGLRQVLYEPSERIHIGPQPPTPADADTIIESVSVRNHGDWFETQDIPLSPFLNAVIGEKGSGKTALTDLVAFATGSWEDHGGSFLQKAGKELAGATITVRWASGRESTATIGDERTERKPQTRYLSQQFVERLCSGDVMAEELLGEVERVVFDYIPEAERMNCSDFRELRAKAASDIQTERMETQQRIVELNQRIQDLQKGIQSASAKKVTLAKYQEDIGSLKTQLSSLLKGEPGTSLELVESLRIKLSNLNASAANKREQLNSLDALSTRIDRMQAKFVELHTSLIEELRKATVPEQFWANFRPVFAGDVAAPLAVTRDALARDLQSLEGTSEDLAGDISINALHKSVKAEEDKLQLDDVRKRRVGEIQSKMARLDADSRRLQSEITDAERAERDLLPKAWQERLRNYLRYFELVGQERLTLQRLYQPLHTYRTEQDEQNRSLEFEVSTVVDLKRWAEKGESMLDLRRSRQGAIYDHAESKLVDAWRSGDATKIRSGIESLVEVIAKEGLGSKLRTGFTSRDIADWVFSVDHIRLEYGLKYEGVPLRFLSPGTRGILLLILYLSMDRNDDRPLLIDQPEENLDNASVYDVLVRYFRQAKKRRQIVVISHNPNLVVNTDAEEVIVAQSKRRENGLPRMTYQAGPLEIVPGALYPIRGIICQVLEGGKEAFIKREERYDLDSSTV